MSEYQTQSNSMYLAGMKIGSATGVRSIYDAWLRCCSVAECATKTIGLRLDNRTSSQFEEKSEKLQTQTTNIEDMYGMDMGTAGIGTMVYISARWFASRGHCISSICGNDLYQVVADALRGGKTVSISFRNIRNISSAFLESSIGQLYKGDFAEEEIKNKVVVCDLSDDDEFVLKMIIDRIKDYSNGPDHFEAVINEILGEADE
jgi:hypothetical protein